MAIRANKFLIVVFKPRTLAVMMISTTTTNSMPLVVPLVEVVTPALVVTFLTKATNHGVFLTVVDFADFTATFVEQYSLSKAADGFPMSGTDKLSMACDIVSKSIPDLVSHRLISDEMARDIMNVANLKLIFSSVVAIWNRFKQVPGLLKRLFGSCCKCKKC